MNYIQEQYQSKLRTADEIAATIQPNTICATSTGTAEPVGITAAIGRHVREHNISGVIHHQTMSIHPSSFFDPALNGKYNAVSWFSTEYGRKAFAEGRAEMLPTFFRDGPKVYADYIDVDVFYATVSPMDEHGYFSLGTSCAEAMTLLQKAKRCFLEVNENMPRTFGNNAVHISQVTMLCRNDVPLTTAGSTKIDDVSRAIGELIAERIVDGSTIQLGIGAVPDAVGSLLKGKRNLGIHTELFTDSMMELIECGAVTNSTKKTNRFKSVTTFAHGSQRMYEFLNNNVGVEFHPVDYTNDPAVIAQNDNFVSVNACLEVDFWGQVASESIGLRHYSGTGGQVDFVQGAIASKNGQSFLTLPSTAKGGTISRIVPMLKAGTIVSTTKNDVDNIVTEYGVAKLRGRTISQRVKALIEIAHPDFRDQLRFEARKMNLI